MVTIPSSLLLVISSPYARRGILWDAYRRFYGTDNPSVLVWKAGTVEMHPSIDRAFLDAEHAKDPAAARAEYDAEFRDDIESYVSLEAVDKVVMKGARICRTPQAATSPSWTRPADRARTRSPWPSHGVTATRPCSSGSLRSGRRSAPTKRRRISRPS